MFLRFLNADNGNVFVNPHRVTAVEDHRKGFVFIRLQGGQSAYVQGDAKDIISAIEEALNAYQHWYENNPRTAGS